MRGLVMVALEGGFFEGAVHALVLAIGPWGYRSGQSALPAVFPTDTVKTVPARQELVRLGRELYPIVGQYGQQFIGRLVEHTSQKISRHYPFGAWIQFGKSCFAGAVDGH